MRHLTRCLVGMLYMLGASCKPLHTPPQDITPAPDKQFVLQDITLEERRDGHILWTGQSAYGHGDLGQLQVSQVQLKRLPQKTSEAILMVRASLGELALQRGEANFIDVQIEHADGAVLQASQAQYNEQAGSLVGQGPIEFTTPNLHLSASSGVLWLHSNTIELQGPIVGKFLGSS